MGGGEGEIFPGEGGERLKVESWSRDIIRFTTWYGKSEEYLYFMIF